MKKIRLCAPAKINTYLRLTGKRPDGFNNLYTVFQKISLADTLIIEKKPQGCSIETHGFKPCNVRDNLIYKAFMLIQKHYPFSGGIHCTLKKRIPAGSGLGGASSNAAQALLGMNRLYSLNLDQETLISFARKLGSDVPFFLSSSSRVLGIERGDVCVPLPSSQSYWVLLMFSSKPLSTKEIYKRVEYSPKRQIGLTKMRGDVIMLTQFLCSKELVYLDGFLKNDLSPIAFSVMPEIKGVLNFLKRHGVRNCAMTGSGPTLFGLFRYKHEAQQAQQLLRSYMRMKTCICKTI